MSKQKIYSNQSSLKILLNQNDYCSQKALPYQCSECNVVSYLRSFNFMKPNGDVCICQKDNRENLFCGTVRNLELDKTIIRQPAFFINGSKRSFDFLIRSTDDVCKYGDKLLGQANEDYIFIEVLDNNHIYNERKKQRDIENKEYLLEAYPNCRIIYVNMPYYNRDNQDTKIQELAALLNDVFLFCVDRVSLLGDESNSYRHLQ